VKGLSGLLAGWLGWPELKKVWGWPKHPSDEIPKLENENRSTGGGASTCRGARLPHPRMRTPARAPASLHRNRAPGMSVRSAASKGQIGPMTGRCEVPWCARMPHACASARLGAPLCARLAACFCPRPPRACLLQAGPAPGQVPPHLQRRPPAVPPRRWVGLPRPWGTRGAPARGLGVTVPQRLAPAGSGPAPGPHHRRAAHASAWTASNNAGGAGLLFPWPRVPQTPSLKSHWVQPPLVRPSLTH
jgi:hypothetical protein